MECNSTFQQWINESDPRHFLRILIRFNIHATTFRIKYNNPLYSINDISTGLFHKENGEK